MNCSNTICTYAEFNVWHSRSHSYLSESSRKHGLKQQQPSSYMCSVFPVGTGFGAYCGNDSLGFAIKYPFIPASFLPAYQTQSPLYQTASQQYPPATYSTQTRAAWKPYSQRGEYQCPLRVSAARSFRVPSSKSQSIFFCAR